MPPIQQTYSVDELDDYERGAILCYQSHMVSPLGMKLKCAYESLVLMVGEEQANIQVWKIVQEYLQDRAA